MLTLKRLLLANTVTLILYLSFWIYATLFNSYLFDNYTSYIYTFVSFIFSLVALYSTSFLNKQGSYFKTPSLILAMGLLCTSIGDLIWYLLSLNSVQIDYPSIADIWYVLFYPITFLGLHVLVLYINKNEVVVPLAAKLIYFESFLLILLGLLLSLKVTSLGFLGVIGLNTASIFDMLYMFSDALLLLHTFVLLGFISNMHNIDHKLISIIYSMDFSLVLLFIADVIFGYTTELGLYVQSDYVDTLFILFTYFMSVSIIKMSFAPKPKPFKA